MAACFSNVLLFGVPRCRPPRRSPGLDPRGILLRPFATLLLFCDEDGK
jgi:hypothetical protein